MTTAYKKQDVIDKTTEDTILITGNQAIAQAVVRCKPKVIPAYPITPQTAIVEAIIDMIDSGEFKTELILLESEHSVMAAAIGASLAGARTYTATASHGLLYMGELVYWAGMTRVPVCIANVNRALNPWNIWADHSDSMVMRDAGWVQMYGKNNQEVLDMTIQSFRIAEHHKIYMPTMVCLDAFILSHTSQLVQVPKGEYVDEFVGEFKPLAKLDPAEPFAHGSLTGAKELVELRQSIIDSMENAKMIIPKITKEYAEKFGRYYGDFLEITGDLDEAKVAIVSMGTLGEETEMAIKELEREGIKAAGVRIRYFRPFPKKELVEALAKVEKVIIMDRAVSFGNEGQIAIETKAALYDAGVKVEMHPLIRGIGGSDVTFQDIMNEVKKVL
ncbi:MAG: transketolase C-terminal domain-containing protein [Candidatus Odinarchaeota archaeon]